MLKNAKSRGELGVLGHLESLQGEMAAGSYEHGGQGWCMPIDGVSAVGVLTLNC